MIPLKIESTVVLAFSAIWPVNVVVSVSWFVCVVQPLDAVLQTVLEPKNVVKRGDKRELLVDLVLRPVGEAFGRSRLLPWVV